MIGKYITTTFTQNKKREKRGTCNFINDTGAEENVINLYPDVTGQMFEGFGGAFTDSAGYVYSQMSDEDKKKVLTEYFSETGLNYVMGRIHLDSCDFCLEEYEAMSDPQDREMNSFSLERMEKYIFPFLDDVKKFTGKNIDLMVSPWSPPAFMKTNGRRCKGGKLKTEYADFWAEYICHYIVELKRRGYKIQRMSLQNEPKAVQTWDSCIYTAEEEKKFLKKHLYPSMKKYGITDVEIYIWDHNKERVYERARDIIDAETDCMISGIAFHWYSGDHFEALGLIREQFPDKKLILSEACIEYSKYAASDYLKNAQKYAHDLIGNLNQGMNAFYDWNLILDEKGGPNHAENYCDAPYLYDLRHHHLIERNTLSYIRHFSHYIRPGAVRIGFSRYTDQIEMTAFKNADNQIAVVIMNSTDNVDRICLRVQGKETELELSAKSITTVVIIGE